MKNCLVTKLKASVNNDNLEKIGVLRIELPANLTISNRTINMKQPYGVLRLVSGSATFYNVNNVEVPFPVTLNYSGQYIKIVTGESGAVLELTNKYSLQSVDILPYLTNNVNIDWMQYCSLLYCNFQAAITCLNITGAIENLIKGISSDSTATVFNIQNMKGLTGNVNSIGSHTNFTTLNLANTVVEGSIEGIVANEIAAGKTTGSITVNCSDNKITFEGIKIGAQGQVSSVFTWDAQGNITRS